MYFLSIMATVKPGLIPPIQLIEQVAENNFNPEGIW